MKLHLKWTRCWIPLGRLVVTVRPNGTAKTARRRPRRRQRRRPGFSAERRVVFVFLLPHQVSNDWPQIFFLPPALTSTGGGEKMSDLEMDHFDNHRPLLPPRARYPRVNKLGRLNGNCC